jgi:RNA polymerase sigma factor (sigma-70 family)
VAQKRLAADSVLAVYENGFALYEAGSGKTVFHADYCGGYTYFTHTGQKLLDEEFFLGKEWWVRLLLEGEDRLTHNRNVRNERNEVFCSQGETEWGDMEDARSDLLGAIIRQELLAEAYSLMTPKQKEIVDLYYLEQLNLHEIAERLGISFQAVFSSLSDTKKKIQKKIQYFK